MTDPVDAAVPSTDPPSDERPGSESCDCWACADGLGVCARTGGRVTLVEHAAFVELRRQRNAFAAVPSLPVPDPPDDVLAVIHAFIAGEVGRDEGEPMREQAADLLDALAAAGAVVVFAEGLPMGARLACCCPRCGSALDPDPDDGLAYCRNAFCAYEESEHGPSSLWRVLTDKEPTDD